MHVLLTGSSGRIGSQLVAALQKRGHIVRGFDLGEPRGVVPDEMVVGSLLDAEAVRRATEGVEAVIHLAALMSWHPRDEAALFESNVMGTFNLLRACAGIGRFVLASSGEVYPELNPQYQPLDEAHPTLPTSAYGMTKLLAEDMVRHYGRRLNLPCVILRFSHTQAADELLDPNSFFSGPRFYVNAKIRQLEGLPASPAVERSLDALRAIATPAEQHYIGCSPDGVPYRMGMCDVRDMIQGIVLGLEHPAAPGDVFNIGAASSFNFDEAVPYLARVTGMNVVRVALATTAYRYDTSVDKARRVLGYTPQYDIFRMIDDAAQRALARHATGGQPS
ncbi:MAG: NAD(P)-dependent oxidoreductase [Anaerolineae bacterium]|nr:NAD(P)-dependent oxidoreductase [Anaerolineae bacterium]